MKPIVFRDQVKLYTQAGNGGDGSAYFRREKFVPFGGPSGGDGGDGGDVILVGNDQIDSLLDLYDRPHQRAEHGEKGGTNQSTGRRGKTLRVPVPRGTVVRLEEKDGPILGEVMADGEELLVAKGGVGGKGNIHFKTSSNQAPKEWSPGTEGEQKILWLELKLIADVGLVGYPNAGKSTLLSRLTHAHPKVASYPFTTLHPMLGTLEFDDFRRVRIADIPGLIDGAHDGVGLGHEFLRHIERTRLLVFVIDMGAVDGRDPVDDFRNLREELRLHNPELDERPYLVVGNKMDDPLADEHLERFEQETGEPVLKVMAELGEGVEELKAELHRRVYGANPPPDLLA
jgi:GTP-binding protein